MEPYEDIPESERGAPLSGGPRPAMLIMLWQNGARAVETIEEA
jgi:hypothetical protein